MTLSRVYARLNTGKTFEGHDTAIPSPLLSQAAPRLGPAPRGPPPDVQRRGRGCSAPAPAPPHERARPGGQRGRSVVAGGVPPAGAPPSTSPPAPERELGGKFWTGGGYCKGVWFFPPQALLSYGDQSICWHPKVIERSRIMRNSVAPQTERL